MFNCNFAFFLALTLWIGCELPLRATTKDLRWDEEHEAVAQGKSRNLARDIRAMWRVVPLPGEAFSVSPVSAIHAAERVFNTLDLTRLSREEVSTRLRVDMRSPAYGYRAPFWGGPKGADIYRFDCGNFGWEFAVIFGRDGKVKEVTRRWIH